jgi:aminocarboxymuconate-semialdehyde decarboxylase
LAHSPIDTKEIGPKDVNRYGPTAARKVSTGRIRPTTRTVDAHAHIMIAAADTYMEPFTNQDSRPLMRQANPVTREIMHRQFVDRRTAMCDFDDRIAIMDSQAIDVQVLAPFPPQSYYHAAPEHTVKSSRIVNDGIAEFMARRPERFVGLGTVPLNQPDEAPKELERVVKSLGFRGVQIFGNVNGVEISDKIYEPFWKKAAELGAVVMIHPDGFSAGDRFGEYFFPNVIGIPLDTAVALHYIVFNGLLERYPDLKIYSVHGGGYAAPYSGRMDHAWGARVDAHGSLPKRPSDYLRKVYFDGLVFTPHQLDYLVSQYGADHIMMGTDYPFDMGEYFPIEHVASAPGFTEAQRTAVMGGTATKLFNIPE